MYKPVAVRRGVLAKLHRVGSWCGMAPRMGRYHGLFFGLLHCAAAVTPGTVSLVLGRVAELKHTPPLFLAVTLHLFARKWKCISFIAPPQALVYFLPISRAYSTQAMRW